MGCKAPYHAIDRRTPRAKQLQGKACAYLTTVMQASVACTKSQYGDGVRPGVILEKLIGGLMAATQ